MSYEDAVLVALAESLDSIDGLQNSAYLLSNPTAPTVEVLPGDIEYDQSFGSRSDTNDKWYAIVRVTVGANFDIGSQKRLREFREPSGPTSIKQALEADRSLGGLVESLHVTKCSSMRQFRRPGGEAVLGCDFEVTWYGSGG